jgi:lipopolysaccharide transport system permease protein
MPLPGDRQIPRLMKAPLASAAAHRRLLREFVVREVKGRFAGSAAGVLWTLIHPLATIVVYLFLFSVVMRVQVSVEQTGTGRFAVFFLSGLFPWLLFAESLSRSVGSLVDNANLITRVVFPVELLPMSTVAATFIVNGVGMTLFLGYLAIGGYGHTTWALLLLLVPMEIAFTLGAVFLVTAACVFLRDVRELLGIVLMVWFFGTPILYPASMIPHSLRLFFRLNPMAFFVDLYRDALLVHEIHWMPLAIAGLLAAVSYGIGAWFFMRAKPAFGDVL